MQKTGTKQGRTAVVILVVALLLAALAGVVYLVVLREPAPAPAAPPAESVQESANVQPDAAPARPDAPRPVDAAVQVDAQAQISPGARRPYQRTVDETPRPPDARPPDARPPDARKPDTRPPDAPKPDYGKLPAWPKGFKHKPARVVAVHHNRMGKSFVLVALTYTIDGRQVFRRADASGELNKERKLKTFSGSMKPGQHSLMVHAVYRGGTHGVFSYHQRYRYRVRAQYTFTANPGRRVRITVEGVEKGGPNTPLKEKLSLKFKHRVSAK